MRDVQTSAQHFYPVRPEPRRIRKTHPMARLAPPLSTLPRTFDFGSQRPAVRNQAQEGSCTGHGWRTGTMTKRVVQGLSPVDDLSPQFIYALERMQEGDFNQDAGAQVGTGAQVLLASGVCREELWPYLGNDLYEKPSDAAYADAAARKLSGYARLDGSPESVCAALAAGNPVVFGFHVYPSFEGAGVAATGIVPMPGSSESELGGHCMCFTGYEITDVGHGGNCLTRLLGGAGASDGWLFADNSWGTGWGILGRCKLSFAFVRKYCFDLTSVVQFAG